MNKLGMVVTVGVVAAAGGFFAGSMAAGTKDPTLTALKDEKWTPIDAKAGDKGPQMAVVFGDPKAAGKPLGFLLKLPAGFKPGPHTHTSDDYAVVVQGSAHNFVPGADEGAALTAGGTWFQPGKKVHDNHCDSKEDCILFVYTPAGFDFVPAPAAPAKK